MLSFENVGLRYDVGPEILRDISFSLEPGTFHFLTGRSGAGKTSLLRLMFLGLNPTRGRIRLFGHTPIAVNNAWLASTAPTAQRQSAG